MQSSETPIHSFIVKMWMEDISCEDGETIWRGHITHVPSGGHTANMPSEGRRYFSSLEEINRFIAAHLEAIEDQLGLGKDDG